MKRFVVTWKRLGGFGEVAQTLEVLVPGEDVQAFQKFVARLLGHLQFAHGNRIGARQARGRVRVNAQRNAAGALALNAGGGRRGGAAGLLHQELIAPCGKSGTFKAAVAVGQNLPSNVRGGRTQTDHYLAGRTLGAVEQHRSRNASAAIGRTLRRSRSARQQGRTPEQHTLQNEAPREVAARVFLANEKPVQHLDLRRTFEDGPRGSWRLQSEIERSAPSFTGAMLAAGTVDHFRRNRPCADLARDLCTASAKIARHTIVFLRRPIVSPS